MSIPLAAPSSLAGPPPAAARAFTWIKTASELASWCGGWHRSGVLGLDTEFVRERTFYPGLGLIQISDGQQQFLIDPLAIADLSALAAVLLDPGVIKVFHSASEDLEVLFHRLGRFPQPLFDTQIAAAFAGLGYSLSYGRLVQQLFDWEVPKVETRTDWLQRPLSPAQLEYAALDVAFLVPAFKRLYASLEQSGRTQWVAEECATLSDRERFLPDPQTLYLRFPRLQSLKPRELATLQALANWRETTARQTDQPRNFLVREGALLQIAKRRPQTLKELSGIPDLRPGDVRRYGQDLLQIVRTAAAIPPSALPSPIPTTDLTPYRDLLQQMRRLVQDKAAELGLPPELLATSKMLKALLERVAQGQTPILPPELAGWRYPVLGAELRALVQPLGRAG